MIEDGGDIFEEVKAEELRSRNAELEHELVILKESLRKKEVDGAACQTLEEENSRLIRTVRDLQEKLSALNEEHQEEADALKKEAFNARVELEDTFRKTLQDLDKKYKGAAFAEISNESKNALKEKARAQNELAVQTIGIEALTTRYEAQVKLVQELRTNNGVLKEHQLVQAKKISSLKQQLGKAHMEKDRLKEELEKLKKQVERFNVAEKAKKELEDRNTELEKTLQRAQENERIAQSRIKKLSEKVRHMKLAGKTPVSISANKKLPPSVLNQDDELYRSIVARGRVEEEFLKGESPLLHQHSMRTLAKTHVIGTRSLPSLHHD